MNNIDDGKINLPRVDFSGLIAVCNNVERFVNHLKAHKMTVKPKRKPDDAKKVLISFGGNVKRLRILQGLSQDELAYRSTLDRTFLSDTENGKSNVSLSTIYKIAEALHVEASELVSK